MTKPDGRAGETENQLVNPLVMFIAGPVNAFPVVAVPDELEIVNATGSSNCEILVTEFKPLFETKIFPIESIAIPRGCDKPVAIMLETPSGVIFVTVLSKKFGT